MRIWFDTEFIEDGRTIELLSIGMVREDGATYYAETETARDILTSGYYSQPLQETVRPSQWIMDNVVPHLKGGDAVKHRSVIAADVIAFAGDKPEFWAYYADYDWVALCQLFGRMIDLPKGWPMFCRDIKQECVRVGNPRLPEQAGGEHHALSDAQWNRVAHQYLLNMAA